MRKNTTQHVAHHVTLPTLNSPVSDLSNYLFLKKIKQLPTPFTVFPH